MHGATGMVFAGLHLERARDEVLVGSFEVR